MYTKDNIIGVKFTFGKTDVYEVIGPSGVNFELRNNTTGQKFQGYSLSNINDSIFKQKVWKLVTPIPYEIY